jgi:hypothetical protein
LNIWYGLSVSGIREGKKGYKNQFNYLFHAKLF